MSAEIVNSTGLLLLGGGFGIVGQVLRAFVGWIKNVGRASRPAGGAREAFSASRLFVTLFIGFIAGSMATLLSNDIINPTVLSGTAKLCLVAAGYAGTDFIEGIAGRFAASAAPSMTSRGKANLLRN